MKKKNFLKIVSYIISILILIAVDNAGKLTHSQFWFVFIALDFIFTMTW